MNLWFSFIIVAILFLISLMGSAAPALFGIVIPYVAFAVFVIGLICKTVGWARRPVPFREPTVSGQQKSLSWIKANNLESPHNLLGVIGRMFLEVFFFRSLFKNTTTQITQTKDGKAHIVYKTNIFLWLAAIIFHWSFLVILLRHFRFFTSPPIKCVLLLEKLDSLFVISLPNLYLTNIAVVAGLFYLLIRRVTDSKVRYISLVSDYFALFILLMIALTGIFMRYFYKVDLTKVKEFVIGLITFSPQIHPEIGNIFYIHLFFISILLFYFPFSKLLHMAGVFFSPTRNMANNNRTVRHVNPWDYPVKCHTYEEWEDDFRKLMKGAGLPVDKE